MARFGGDEFAILHSACLTVAAQNDLCQRVVEAARSPFPLERGLAQISTSVGLAVARDEQIDAHELMRRADIALYAAKAARQHGYQIFNAALDQRARDKITMEADLRAALQDGGQTLALHYQAKVDSHGTIKGVEALLRWRHPQFGIIPIDRVIALAEETGLINPLGNWVLHAALAFTARWPDLDVAINVSPLQLHQPRFVEDVLAAYGATASAHSRLELELTETALMGDIDILSAKLAVLRNAGIRIALDDFGTGSSSMRHLYACAVDRIKIDQSFVAGIGTSPEASAIIHAVVQLGHAMNLAVTAEGVETPDQWQFLIEAGADEFQGYLFSKPIEEEALSALVN